LKYQDALSLSEITGIEIHSYTRCNIVCDIIACHLAAYAFVYVALPYKRTFFLYLLAASAIPGWAIAVPIFIYVRKAGLFDTYPALIYVMTGYLLPFCTWMLISFFVNIPKELPEAALIDGC
jgi:ABC-type glycerol-3-phosphate transport system permease component